MNNESLPVDLAAFYLAMSQTNSLDEQIKGRLETIRSKQKEISYAREILVKVKDYKAKNWAIGATYDWSKDPATYIGPDFYANFCKERGIDFNPATDVIFGGSKEDNASKFDVLIERVNNYIKDQNSSVELDMLTIQSFMSKRNQALQMSSTLMKKSNESKESIIRHLG